MQKNGSSLTVLFEDPFWIGIYERQNGSKLEVAKIVFGAEPKANDIYAYLRDNWYCLQFSPPVENIPYISKKTNPKRLQRQIKKQVADSGIGTKAQQALKLQQEEGKLARKGKARLQREEQEQRLFSLKQTKKKAKHKGH